MDPRALTREERSVSQDLAERRLPFLGVFDLDDLVGRHDVHHSRGTRNLESGSDDFPREPFLNPELTGPQVVRLVRGPGDRTNPVFSADIRK